MVTETTSVIVAVTSTKFTIKTTGATRTVTATKTTTPTQQQLK
jgi:hypothetical protein